MRHCCHSLAGRLVSRASAISLADDPDLILGLGLNNVGITLVCPWVRALGQCSDKFPLEGDDVLGCWLSEWFPLLQQGLDLDEVPGASSHTVVVPIAILVVGLGLAE